MTSLIFIVILAYGFGDNSMPYECPKEVGELHNCTDPVTTLAPDAHHFFRVGPYGAQDGRWDESGRLLSPRYNLTTDFDDCQCHSGCPVAEQSWCETIPPLTGVQMIVGFALIFSGYPLGSSMSNAIFSKIIGPHPQGTYMGMLGAGACLARILCPLCVTGIYSTAGTWATFGFMTGLMVVIIGIVVIFFKKLVPYRYEDAAETGRH